MLRVIREIQPTWVVGENVPGLVNWSNGVVFEEVQSDLEDEGYEVLSFICSWRTSRPPRMSNEISSVEAMAADISIPRIGRWAPS